MPASPYTAPGVAETDIATVPVYAMPQQRAYAAPALEEGDAYNDEFGWSPTVGRASTTETPSAQRVQSIPRIDFVPDPTKPPEQGFYAQRDADEKKRHSVEDQNATGWREQKGVNPGDIRWALNPRMFAPPEPRVTSALSPRTYAFTRPFDQHSARQFNGNHFSMASFRRDYEILGMAPVRTARNTYRLEPTPWDIDVVDLPPTNVDDRPVDRIRSVEVPPARTSYRLG